MAMSDPISDMFARMRNAILARKEFADMPSSKMKKDLARILKQEGYLSDYKTVQNGIKEDLRVFFKSDPKEGVNIHGIKRQSKPGRRVYVNARNIPRVISGLGMAMLSTSKGIITDRQARKLGLGGEVIGLVW